MQLAVVYGTNKYASRSSISVDMDAYLTKVF